MQMSRLLSFTARKRDEARPLVSVVVPVFNEEECLNALYQRLTAVLEGLRDDYELVFVNDGSKDSSLHVLRSLRDRDARVGFYSFSRNFGHEAATTCGLMNARGQTVVIIDADLQDPPELIPEMVERWREGYDIVYAQRRSRAGESWFTRATSHLFYRTYRRLAKVEIPVDTGDFRLMDRKVVDAFASLPERSRFVRGMISWTGFRQTAILFDRDPRLAGQTKYNFFKRLRLAMDAFCGMSVLPLRGITHLGLFMGALSLLLGLGSGLAALVFGAVWSVWFVASAAFFFSGVQLLSIGLVGEYVGRIYMEVQQRPVFIVAESDPPRVLSSDNSPTLAVG
ncbi:MAG: glycosyltransferase family 2 protein [Planctomycetota bacterium]